MKNPKIFSINEYDVVAAESLEQAVEWYKKTGGDVEPDEFAEYPLTGVMWSEYDGKDKRKIWDELEAICQGNSDYDISGDGMDYKGRRFSMYCGSLYILVTYAEELKKQKADESPEPFVISSSEV
jgi:hypothetical protein